MTELNMNFEKKREKIQSAAPQWTKDQQKVIDLRDRSLLVSAAAGSGKTAVLVERIISMITDRDHPVDVDQLLVVTFTNGAAAEMRERVLKAIEAAVDADPSDVHLQRQMALIHNAQITTIDSFCNYVLKNHFHKIGLEPGFRIADQGELTLLREDVCDQVLETFYANHDEQFLRFADSYSTAKSDQPIRDMILRLYDFSQSYPWPQEWLKECVEQYQAETIEELEEKHWVADFLSYLHVRIREDMDHYEEIYAYTLDSDGPQIYESVVADDLRQLRKLLSCEHLVQWQETFASLDWKRLPPARKYEGSQEKKDAVTDARIALKKQMQDYQKKYFSTDMEQQRLILQRTAEMVGVLVRLTSVFAADFRSEKMKKNIMDFSDVEHNALDILVDSVTKEPTETAAEFRARFKEIMIDEYQDSNYVQEALLTAVSGISCGEENLFMVGDVKQSIYRFRLARPELFMEKYDRFSTEEGRQQRIDLHRNFRSRQEVIGIVNDIFMRIMGRDLGNVEYDQEAALYLGASFEDYDNKHCCEPECLLVTDDPFGEDKRTAEARAVAQRIKALVGNQEIPGKQYKDCVILLRSLSNWAETFQRVFEQEGIPLVVASQTGYFSAPEVQTMLSFLRVLDNPCQDIPLAAVMKSDIGHFSSKELAQIRAMHPELPFYQCVRAEDMAEKGAPGLQQKLDQFWEQLISFRQRIPYTPIHRLLQQIYDETHFRDYVTSLPAGEQRRANLDMLLEKAIAYEQTSYHGLYHFVRYIDRLMKYDIDYGEAEIIGEQENAVGLMTIHKSKGLEFPVVIVAGMGKKFNMMDANSSMIFHPEYGIALKWANLERRIKTDTLIRQIFSIETRRESLGEELRILYVALTRAKEKLIMTGFSKDERKKGRRLAAEEKLDFSTRMDASCYWDWVIPALESYGGRYSIEICSFPDRLEQEQSKQEIMIWEKNRLEGELLDVDPEIYEELSGHLTWKYPFEKDERIKQKVSVSEIKHRAIENVAELLEDGGEKQLFPQEIPCPYIPRFIEEQEKNQGALRGTAMHRFMECLDFGSLPCFNSWKDAEPILEIIGQEMLRTGRMTLEELELVNFSQIYQFLITETARQMTTAAKRDLLTREQPFVMSLPADQVWPEMNAKEPVLVQGIIDVFWEDEEGLYLLDYKTDRAESPEELVKRYRAQLMLYGDALERTFAPKKVKGIMIYSFRFHQILQLAGEK